MPDMSAFERHLALPKWYIDQLDVVFSKHLTISKAVQERLTQSAGKSYSHSTTILSHAFDQWQKQEYCQIYTFINKRQANQINSCRINQPRLVYHDLLSLERRLNHHVFLCLGRVEKTLPSHACVQTYPGSEKSNNREKAWCWGTPKHHMPPRCTYWN